MKHMRLAMCVAIFALVGGIAMSEDMDVRALQSRLAAQEATLAAQAATLNDLKAKMSSKDDGKVVAKGVTSIRKKAVVTIGGEVNSRYVYRIGKSESKLAGPNSTFGANGMREFDGRGMTKRVTAKGGDTRVEDAKLEFKIDVNDHFDAYLKLDLHDTTDANAKRAGVGQYYWIRWKKICNTGWSVTVGRDSLRWGRVQTFGQVTQWTKDNSAINEALPSLGTGVANNAGEGMLAGRGPAHSYWNVSRITQIAPTWENCDGSFKAEFGFLQAIDSKTGLNAFQNTATSDSLTAHYKTINFGFGSVTSRFTWKPIEGLRLVASIMNLRAEHGGGYWNAWYRNSTYSQSKLRNDANKVMETASNNTAINLVVDYRPCWAKNLLFFASFTESWNDKWIKDLDSTVLTYGAQYNLTDRLAVFGLGEYINTRNKQAITWNRAEGWAATGGLNYKLPYGVLLEGGVRYERIDYKNALHQTHTKVTGTTFYMHCGFAF